MSPSSQGIHPAPDNSFNAGATLQTPLKAGIGAVVRFFDPSRDCQFKGRVVDVEPETGNLFVAVLGYKQTFQVDALHATIIDTNGEPPIELEQLLQCLGPVEDGRLVSQTACDQLLRNRLLVRTHGWSVISEEGLRILVMLGFLKA